jgi:hypothetical protein
VDTDRIWFKAAHGLEGVKEIGRDPGLCGSAILRDDALIIPDTLRDPVAANNPLVAGKCGGDVRGNADRRGWGWHGADVRGGAGDIDADFHPRDVQRFRVAPLVAE